MSNLFIIDQAFDTDRKYSAFNYLSQGALELSIELSEQNAPIEWYDIDTICLGNP